MTAPDAIRVTPAMLRASATDVRHDAATLDELYLKYAAHLNGTKAFALHFRYADITEGLHHLTILLSDLASFTDRVHKGDG